ncbi:MAG TPA: branched-chain amino acid ABC transporter permease, partial [Kiloniellales bacterium]|nr:branched-chain amino acid ABC transporter permease [Kiloniellales bacterium]
CMFVIAPLFVGLVGVIIERLIVRYLYGRMMDTLLATWGLSLFIIGLMTTLFGNTMEGISTPLGSYRIGGLSDSVYKFVVIAVAVFVLVGLYLLLKFTRFGLVARGTMENAAQASVMGVNPRRVYTVTFGVGAALSVLAGAVLAPISGVLPSMGVAYIGKAFITVIGGGEAIVTGTATAATLFGTVNQVTTYAYSAVVGEVALLFTAIVMLRILPQGITGRFFRRSI